MTDNNQDEKSNTIKVLRDTVFVVAIYLYFTGWIYVYYLYCYFGISLNVVEIPVYDFFIYSSSVLMNWHTLIVLVPAVLAIYFFNIHYAVKWAPVLILIILFPALFFLSKHYAQTEALMIRKGTSSKKIITLFFKTDVAHDFPEGFQYANKNRALKLLTQTKDMYIVFFQPPYKQKLKLLS